MKIVIIYKDRANFSYDEWQVCVDEWKINY